MSNPSHQPPGSSARTAPHSLEAERAVLGAITLDNATIDDAKAIVTDEMFFLQSHQILFRAVVKLHEKRRPADAMTLAEALTRTKQLAEVGGLEALREIIASVPHTYHLKRYAEIVRDKWMLRELTEVCHSTLRDAFGDGDRPDTDAREILDAAAEKVFGLTTKATDAMDERTDMGSLMLSHHDELVRRIAGDNPGVPSGFPTLDGLTNGFGRKRVYVVAARPGVGKTALLCKMLLSMGQNRPLFFSLEQPKLDVADRLLSISAGIDLKAIQRGNGLTDADRSEVERVQGDLCALPIHIDDRTNRTVAQLTSTARIHRRKNNIGCILIDYLQLIAPENRRAPEHEQVAEISRGLLSMAKELDVPIVALAQMNREVDKRPNRTPKLSDLRGSGAIEQDAYLIAFLDVPSLYNPDIDSEKASLIIAKHRNGELGEIPLKWERTKVTFTDLSEFSQAYGGFMSPEANWSGDTFGSDQPQFAANYGQ